MSFFGKQYAFAKEENFEDFIKSLGVTPEQTQAFMKYHPNQKLVQDSDSYTLITETPERKKEITFKSGVPFEEKIANRTCQTTFTVDGNVVNQNQKFEGEGEINTKREFSDTELVVTITCTKFDGVARRYYKAL